MSSAPMSTTSESKEAADRAAKAAPRGSEQGSLHSLRGRLHPPALGRFGRTLVYVTGLFLLRPLLHLACRLVGWQRRAHLRYEGGELYLDTELSVLAISLRKETERLPCRSLVSASKLWTKSPELVALGGLVLAVGVLWGLWQVVDGIYGRSLALVGLGLGAIAAGAAVDVLLYLVALRLPSLDTQGLVLRTTDAREIIITDLDESARDRLITSIYNDLGQLNNRA